MSLDAPRRARDTALGTEHGPKERRNHDFLHASSTILIELPNSVYMMQEFYPSALKYSIIVIIS